MPKNYPTGSRLNIITIFSIDSISIQFDTEYNEWLNSYREALQAVAGFISIDAIAGYQQSIIQYYLLIKFESEVHYSAWLNASESLAILAKRHQLVTAKNTDQQANGVLTHFTLPAVKTQPLPTFWKRALVTICCVYPLLMFLIWLLKPILSSLPVPFAMLINVIIAGSLLTHPILPFAFRTLAPWLNKPSQAHPKKTNKSTSNAI